MRTNGINKELLEALKEHLRLESDPRKHDIAIGRNGYKAWLNEISASYDRCNLAISSAEVK